MGTIQHEVLAVTSWLVDGREDGSQHATIVDAHLQAKQIFGPLVSDLRDGVVNGYKTFTVMPSGSKLGWDEEELHKGLLRSYIGWLRKQTYEDGSSSLDWVLVSFGECGAGVLETNCDDQVGEAETWKRTWTDVAENSVP